MIIVTGTKRSGTSLWMQILKAAGFDFIGEAFPQGWGQALKEANPHGFFESKLVSGVYFETNPDPASGDYLYPEEVSDLAVKVFAPGLIRTELAFIDRAIVTVRPWWEHTSSWRRFEELCSRHGVRTRALAAQTSTLHPAIEWWMEYYSLVRDIAIRRYPVHVQAYAALLDAPGPVLKRTFEWLGRGRLECALKVVQPALSRSHHGACSLVDAPRVSSRCVRTFDRLYEAFVEGAHFDEGFLRELNECQEEIQPMVLEHDLACQRDLLSAVAP